jgi:hypothetical protein
LLKTSAIGSICIPCVWDRPRECTAPRNGVSPVERQNFVLDVVTDAHHRTLYNKCDEHEKYTDRGYPSNLVRNIRLLRYACFNNPLNGAFVNRVHDHTVGLRISLLELLANSDPNVFV